MRVLWLSHHIPYPPVSGALVRSYNLIKEVAKDHDIDLIAFIRKQFHKTNDEITRSVEQLRKLCSSVKVLPLPLEHTRLSYYGKVLSSAFSTSPFGANSFFSTPMTRAIQNYMESASPDCAFVETLGLAIYHSLLEGIPKVLQHHDEEYSMMHRRARNERNLIHKAYFTLEAPKLRRFIRVYCPIFDCNFTVSMLDKSRLKSIAPGASVEVVPNGVDVSLFRPSGHAVTENNLLFIGALKFYPNRDAVIYFVENVWPLIRNSVPSATFTVVGKDPPRRVIRHAEVDPAIELTGFVEDVRPFLDRAHVYVCPIRDGGGTKIKVFEAMAAGKAIVSTSLGCEGIEVQHGKQVLIADTAPDMAAEVVEVLNNAPLRRILEREARKFVEERYSWNAIGSGLSTFLERIGQPRGPVASTEYPA